VMNIELKVVRQKRSGENASAVNLRIDYALAAFQTQYLLNTSQTHDSCQRVI
jgi:hypothetical protein